MNAKETYLGSDKICMRGNQRITSVEVSENAKSIFICRTIVWNEEVRVEDMIASTLISIQYPTVLEYNDTRQCNTTLGSTGRHSEADTEDLSKKKG